MSLRKYNKDHLKGHAGVTLAAPVRVDTPESGDPLVFWTQHEKEPCEVNLHPFVTGQQKTKNKTGGGAKFIPFTGRPELIRQLTPAIQEALFYVAKATVNRYMNALRDWWRLLDAVEEAAATTGQPLARVDDVRLLTDVHSEFAHRSGIIRQSFGAIRGLVDTTRMAFGLPQTYWETPEAPDVQEHIPPQEQRNALRLAIRNTCRKVLERWEQSERLEHSETEPDDAQEVELWRNVRYMRQIQKETGKILPAPGDLRDGIAPWALNSKQSFKLSVRKSVFPTHWDAEAVWHQCLMNTGWNPSTLKSLDVTKRILIDHFKDNANDPHRRFVLCAETYDLVGEKERAGGNEQFVTGQWKTLDGPGHLIKTYLKRVAPLREILKQQLDQAKLEYEEAKNADFKVRSELFAQLKSLEQGVRSVWLFVDRRSKVGWMNLQSRMTGRVNGKPTVYLDEVVQLLNAQRAATNTRRAAENKSLLAAVPYVLAKDFRVWFADYVYRSSNGNMLHVKKALNHARTATASVYTNTNILNQEANEAARRFLNILVGEMEVGRVDLTILSHLYRYGKVTPEQEEALAQARTLPKSRMKVACKDARHPPSHIKATEGMNCDVQRCLLCVEHAVLLPESLDGIAMRAEELRALQGFLPIETWVEELFDIELKNNLVALRKFDLNQSIAARKKWAQAISTGDHYVPGLPLASLPDLMDLV